MVTNYVFKSNFAKRSRYDKVQFGQELKPHNHPFCFHFARSTNEKLHNDVDFAKKKKSSFRMTLIFILMATLISIIPVFGTQRAHTRSYGNQCTHYEWLAERRHYFYENEDKVSITFNGDT